MFNMAQLAGAPPYITTAKRISRSGSNGMGVRTVGATRLGSISSAPSWPFFALLFFSYPRVGRSFLLLRFHLRQRRFEQLLRRGKEDGVQRAVAHAVGGPLELRAGGEERDEMR